MPEETSASPPRPARRFRVTVLGLMVLVAIFALFVFYPYTVNRAATQSEAIVGSLRWAFKNHPGVVRVGSEIHVMDGGSGKLWWVTIVDRAAGREVVVSVWSPSNLSGWEQAAAARVFFPGARYRLDGLDPARWSAVADSSKVQKP